MKTISKGRFLHFSSFTMIIMFFVLFFATFISFGFIPPESSAHGGLEDYWPSSLCRGCHGKIYEQYEQSWHAKAFDNPVFKAQYFKEVVPLTFKDSGLLEEAKGCVGCHAPIAYLKTGGHVISDEQVNQETSGVTCDFCHTIRAYAGKSPGNYNYVSVPGTEKLGPFKFKTNWHHKYSELHTKSEFCAVCHNAVNRHGLEIKATYTEWKESRYASGGIHCQDCHMNIQGFLTAGKAVYESGQAARMALADVSYRSKIYSHRFPGAHSGVQVIGALTLIIAPEKLSVSPGETIKISIFIDNTRTGHKMPSGSADLRLLWLDVKAITGERSISVLAADGDGYDVAGKKPSIRGEFEHNIPWGRRIYRAIYVDKTGKQTLSSYDAERIIFDNRLNAAEIRKEIYHFTAPHETKGFVSLVAKLNYMPYPSSFSNRLGVPEPKAVEIARDSKKIIID